MHPIGYSYLNQYYKLVLPKLGLEVYQDPAADTESLVNYGASSRKIIPSSRRIGDTPYHQMIAAIKYQGIRLHFFAAIFHVVDVAEFTRFIREKPNSKHSRVLWYLYEWLMDSKLDIPDLITGNYVTLFDDRYYFTLEKGARDRRTRIVNNAPGTRDFCPMVRKTPEVLKCTAINVYDTAYEKMQSLAEGLSADVIGRSINYLYTKETKSSTEIEKERPDKAKMQRFLNAIKNAGLFALSKEKLIDLQNQIVTDKVKATDYRDHEIYVGSTIQCYNFADEDVHYVGAKAIHIESMMRGLLETHEKLMLDNTLPPLVHATMISFGEVYIHPFEDGNGRIHRYLIHDVLKQREPGHKFIIPISAAILKNSERYDETLEKLSRPLMAMLDWALDPEKGIQINNDIHYMYRYPDYTEHVKFVYDMMNVAISVELIEEMALLIAFDLIKTACNNIADIPNVKLDTLVAIIVQSGGVVSKNKRSLFTKYMEPDSLNAIEILSRELIEDIRVKFDIDIVKILKRAE